MSNQPDILFIFSDQHAQRIAGCYGDDTAQTPALDRLAREGVTFEACYTPSPICGPSRMAMLTGRAPHSTGVWTNNDMLPSGMPTYAHALTVAGYDTISVGRLHALGPDQLRGFSTRAVGDHSPNWPGVARHDMGVLRRTHGPNRISVERSGEGNSAYQNVDEASLDVALAQMDAISQRRRTGDHQPFFLQVGFMLPHPPYVARPEDYAPFVGRVPPPRIAPSAAPHPWIKWWRENRQTEDVTAEETTRSREAYYALVRRNDLHLAAILKRLDSLGLADTTLVIYASDHGDHIGERGLWWKHTMYDESAKVPLVMRWPERFPKNQRQSECVSLLDVTATIIDAAGAEALPNCEARTLVPLVSGKAQDWDDAVFSQYCVDPTEPYSGDRWTLQRMVRSGQWKYVYHDGYPEQLFDLADDPEELNDRAGDPACAKIVGALRTRALAEWDSARIKERMASQAEDRSVLRSWANVANPPDALRWEFDPDINHLANSPN